MSAKLPPMEAGEASMLRAMESKHRGTAAANNRGKPAVYDALKDTGPAHSSDEGAAKPKPKLSRLVRKIMMENQQQKSERGVVAAAAPPSHSRSRSSAEVYDLLKTLKAQSEPQINDVFEEDIFHPDTMPVGLPHDHTSVRSAADASPLVVLDEEQAPFDDDDETPLLQNDEAAVRRLKELQHSVTRCDAATIKAFFWGLLCHCWLLIFAAMLAGLAVFFFYELGNPRIDAIPGNASLSWWCNWFARQFVLFEMTRVIKFLLLDCIVLGSPSTTKYVGPFVTLLALQAKGWPFILAVWGILTACLLQGDNAFQNHWLHRTGWKIYSMEANSGLHIIASDAYLRILLCMIVAGIATAFKRTFVAISFGRRQYSTFKPRLEKLLLDVVLLNELGTLGTHADIIHLELKASSSSVQSQPQQQGPKNVRKKLSDVSWKSVKMQREVSDDGSEELNTGDGGLARSGSSVSGISLLMPQLDRWQEPTSLDKTEATIDDVLRFRRALAFMDETYPFGEDFGRASNRDEAVLAAEDVYHRLCKISIHHGRLPFNTLALIAVEDDGTCDEVKKRALKRLFRPDKDGALTLLAFVHSCDSLYRRLRYFLATVNNSASLDKVLEDLLNGVYYFILGLFLLSLLKYNAWSILLSLTSLLVSFSFAFGQTVSRFVQGIILIAMTRPFDLGDRIFLTSSGEVEKGLENAQNGWFVEDITVSSTKLRFARTGEVAYLSNHVLADMRIYNANRSPRACVVIQQILHISVLEKDNLKKFEESLHKFVKERPRQWVEVLTVCVMSVQSDLEQVNLNLGFRHCDSWQSCPRIYTHRAELLQYIQDTAKKLQVAFEVPPPRRILYFAGELDEGAIEGEEGFRRDLLRPQNVRKTSGSERAVTLPSPLSEMGM